MSRMPWKETCAMDQKLRFIEAKLESNYNMTELCLIATVKN